MAASVSDYLQDVDLPQTYPAPVSWVLRMLRSLREDLIGLIRKGGLSEAVLSVNGSKPDAAGDVSLNVGIKTVNGNAPDENGDITVDDMVSHAALLYSFDTLTETSGVYLLSDRSINSITLSDDTSTLRPSSIPLYTLVSGALVQVASIDPVVSVGSQISCTVNVLNTSGSPYADYTGSVEVEGTEDEGKFQFVVVVNGVRVAFALSASCGKLINAAIIGPSDADWVDATSTIENTITSVVLQPPASYPNRSRDFYINLRADRMAQLSFPQGFSFTGSDADALGPVLSGSKVLLHFTELTPGSFFVDRKEQVRQA